MKRKRDRCQVSGAKVQAPSFRGPSANVKADLVKKRVKNEGASGDVDENKRWREKQRRATDKRVRGLERSGSTSNLKSEITHGESRIETRELEGRKLRPEER